MDLDNRVRQLMKGKMVPAVVSIVMGIVIILARRAALDLLVKIVGGLVIAGAIGLVIVYLKKEPKVEGEMKYALLFAAVGTLAGILLISFAANVVDIFPVLIGIYLILNGLSHLGAAYADQENRAFIAVMGVLVLIMGIMIVCRPGFLVDMILVFIGAAMIVNGIMDLLVVRKIGNDMP